MLFKHNINYTLLVNDWNYVYFRTTFKMTFRMTSICFCQSTRTCFGVSIILLQTVSLQSTLASHSLQREDLVLLLKVCLWPYNYMLVESGGAKRTEIRATLTQTNSKPLSRQAWLRVLAAAHRKGHSPLNCSTMFISFPRSLLSFLNYNVLLHSACEQLLLNVLLYFSQMSTNNITL